MQILMACAKIQNGLQKYETIFGRGFNQDQRWRTFMEGISGSLEKI